MRNKRSLIVVGVSCFLVGALMVARAQLNPPTMIPYEGHLDQNGSPVTGKVDMTFFLVTNPTQQRGAAVWFEDHAEVDVVSGRFAVSLGGMTAIPQSVWANPTLYVGVVVAGAELSGKQRILSAPNAINAKQAGDLNVTGRVTAMEVTTSKLTVNGNATATSINTPTMTATDATATNLTATNLTATTLNVGGFSINQITICSATVPNNAGGNAYVWKAGDCSNGIPAGRCVGMLSTAAACNLDDEDYAVTLPQDGVTPRVGWWAQNPCGPMTLRVSYICGPT